MTASYPALRLRRTRASAWSRRLHAETVLTPREPLLLTEPAPQVQAPSPVTQAVPEQPAGRVGVLSQPTTLKELAPWLESTLGARAWAWGDAQRKIRKVAVVGGAADGEWQQAQRAGADVLVTGEVKQHVAVEAAESGFAIVAAGHYATEQPGVEDLRDKMAEVCPAVDWRLFAPAPGQAGRPL